MTSETDVVPKTEYDALLAEFARTDRITVYLAIALGVSIGLVIGMIFGMVML